MPVCFLWGANKPAPSYLYPECICHCTLWSYLRGSVRNTLPGRAGCLGPASNSSPRGRGRHHLNDDNLCHCFSPCFFPIMMQQVNNQTCFPSPCLMSWLLTAPVLHGRGEESFWESFQPEMLCLHILCQGGCVLLPCH